MDIGAVDTIAWNNLEPELQKVYYEAQIAGMNGEDPEPPPPSPGQDSMILALQRKGKGKGKDMRSKGGFASQTHTKGQKGAETGDRPRNPATAPPLAGEKDQRICHWYLRKGHVMKDCRDKAAGKPKAAKPASSLPRSSKATFFAQKLCEKGMWVPIGRG